MRNAIILIAVAVLLLAASSSRISLAQEREGPPRLTLTGHGEVSAAPDLAIVRLGAVAQAEQARDAQEQVNRTMNEAIKRLNDLGVPEQRITTAQLELSPVFSDDRVTPQKRDNGAVGAVERQPRIVAYRATNTLQIEVADLKKLGEIVDTAVGAGANELQGISFELKNDAAQRRDALRQAAEDARGKARALADAAGVRLAGIQRVTEGGVRVFPQREMLGRAMASMEAATPVQPGQIHVQADVTMDYLIVDAGDDARGPAKR